MSKATDAMHDKLVKRARAALDAVHADAAVPRKQSRKSLMDLADYAVELRKTIPDSQHEEAE